MSTQNKKLLTARQVWTSKKVYWITSYKSLLKYVSSDYPDIFKPIIKGGKSGKRYFILEENVDEFVRKFENNELLKEQETE